MSILNGPLQKRLNLCPACGQPMPIDRLGIQMTALKGRIFDVLALKGGDGILAADLASRMAMNCNTLKVHVHQLNEKLIEVGYRIYGRGGRYRLIRTRKIVDNPEVP